MQIGPNWKKNFLFAFRSLSAINFHLPVTIIINNIFVKCDSCVTTLIAINNKIAKWLKYDGNMHSLHGGGGVGTVKLSAADASWADESFSPMMGLKM